MFERSGAIPELQLSAFSVSVSVSAFSFRKRMARLPKLRPSALHSLVFFPICLPCDHGEWRNSIPLVCSPLLSLVLAKFLGRSSLAFMGFSLLRRAKMSLQSSRPPSCVLAVVRYKAYGSETTRDDTRLLWSYCRESAKMWYPYAWDPAY